MSVSIILLFKGILSMKYQEAKKILGAVAIATTASLTACGTQPTPPIDTAIEAELTQTVEEPTPTPIVETKVTVTYEQSATESDELTIVNNESYSVKDYEPPIYYEYMVNLDYGFRYDEESDSIYIGEELVSDNIDHKEDGSLWVRDTIIADSVPVVKYLRLSDGNEVEARYIGLAPEDSGLISGITFVLNPGDDGVYKIADMLGVYEEDIKELPIYEGVFTAYSKTVDGNAEIKVGDSIEISADLSLYPCFEVSEESTLAADDGTCVEDQIEMIDELPVLRVIHINGTKTDKDGKLVETTKYALADLDAKKDTVKTKDGYTVDKDKVEKQQTEDKLPETKPASQPAKNKESSAQPGQPKPASAVNESPQAQDTFDRGADIAESVTTSEADVAAVAAEDGVRYVDPSLFGTGEYCGIMFE